MVGNKVLKQVQNFKRKLPNKLSRCVAEISTSKKKTRVTFYVQNDVYESRLN